MTTDTQLSDLVAPPLAGFNNTVAVTVGYKCHQDDDEDSDFLMSARGRMTSATFTVETSLADDDAPCGAIKEAIKRVDALVTAGFFADGKNLDEDFPGLAPEDLVVSLHVSI